MTDEKTEDMTILEASKKFPDNISYAFQIEGTNPNVSYFRIEQPKFTKPGGKIRSYVKCLKFDSESIYLVVTNVAIKNEMVIKDLTIKQFTDKVLKVVKTLTDEKQEEKLKPFKVFGFC